MTLEGCVVRMTDTIGYIGRDIEDAIRLNLINREDLPSQSVKCLGNTNGTIVFNLVTDIIENSYQKESISFSPEVSVALKRLKGFNLERIYLNPKIKRHLMALKKMFCILVERYLDDLEHENRSSVIFKNFLKDKSETYLESHTYPEVVRDFIAGMTDQYFLRQFPESHIRAEIVD
jgi:dGTPase